MLAEIGLAISAVKAANEAIGAIKEMCSNIQDVSSIGAMGKDLTKLADAKEKIQADAAKGDAEAFWALEDIKSKESQLKNLMVYGGRAHLWEDYCTFMANRKQMRENESKREEARKLAKKKAIQNGFLYVAVGIAVIGVVGGAVAFVLWLISLKGR